MTDIRVTVVGEYPAPEVKWPEDWPVPREGDSIDLIEGKATTVRTVVWFPQGEEDDPTPFVYVVLGAARQ